MKAGWKKVKLADVAEMRPPKSEVKQKGIKPTDEVGFLPMEDLTQFQKQAKALKTRTMSEVSNSYTYFANGDVLMAKISPCFQNGKMGIATGLPNGVGYGSSEYFVFRPSNELSAEWLFYYLQDPAFRRHATGKFSGNVGQQRLPKELIEDLEIPLPPLAEQKRIVALLDEAFAGIEEAKAKAKEGLSLSKKLFESSLNGMFEVKEGAWVDTLLSDVLEKQPQNGWSPPAANHSSEGTPVLTLSSVTGFAFRPDKIKHTSAKVERSKNYWVENGDLLITRSNTPELVGHVAIAEGITTPTIYPDLIMRMTPKSGHATTEFLYYQLRTSKLRNEITGRAQGANPTMKKISNSAVKTLPVSIPSVKIQVEMSAKLKETEQVSDKLRSMYLEKIGALLELKSSLLAQAFAGELNA
jgi:type I restriction enzyme S subunit